MKRSVRTPLPAAGASLSFALAVVVIVVGVIATLGVSTGSRLAWLLGVACRLLAITALLSWLAARLPPRSPRQGTFARRDLPTVAVAPGCSS